MTDEGFLVPHTLYDKLLRIARDYETGAVPPSQTKDNPRPPRRVTINGTIEAGGVGTAIRHDNGTEIGVYNQGTSAVTGTATVFWSSGSEVSSGRGQWEIVSGGETSSGPPVSLPPGSADMCRCSKCVRGTSDHACTKCGCVNLYRWIPLPTVTPNWVASTDDSWEEFSSSAIRFYPVHLLRYEEDCIWRTEEFNGPPYNPGTGSVMDRYQLELDYNAETPYLKLVRTVDNLAPLIELEWCLADICGESMCLCPWFFRLKKWANVFPIEECQICVTPKIPPLEGKLCDTFFSSSCTQPLFAEFSWEAFESTPDVAFLGARVGQIAIDPDRPTIYPLDYPEPATMPTLNAEGGGKIHVPWIADLSDSDPNEKWFAALIQGEHEAFPAAWARLQVNCAASSELHAWIDWIVDGQRIRQVIDKTSVTPSTMCTDEHVMTTTGLVNMSEGNETYDGTATFPTITLRFVEFETEFPPTSGDAPCGDEIPCSEPCQIRVVLDGDIKKFNIADRTGCAVETCGCEGFECGDPIWLPGIGFAADYEVGPLEDTVACLLGASSGESMEFTVTPGMGCLEGCLPETILFCASSATTFTATIELCGSEVTLTLTDLEDGNWEFDITGGSGSAPGPITDPFLIDTSNVDCGTFSLVLVA
jgi:hypothetical protein